MISHSAFGRRVESLSVAIVDGSDRMSDVLRSMLFGLGLKEVRCYQDPRRALRRLRETVPDLVFTADRLDGISGQGLVEALRQKRLKPLCFVPAIIYTGRATRQLVETAFRAGANQVLVVPVAPKLLMQRLTALMTDARPFVEDGERYVIQDATNVLAAASSEDRRAVALGHTGTVNDG